MWIMTKPDIREGDDQKNDEDHDEDLKHRGVLLL